MTTRKREKISRTPKASVSSASETDVNVEEYLKPPEAVLDGSETADKPKRKYKPRTPKAQTSGATLGTFMRGFGAILAQGVGAVVGEDSALTADEGAMLEYTGNCAQEFGGSDMLDEQVGKFGMYLIAGSLAVIAASRIIPALRKRRQRLIPEAAQVQ